MSPIPLALEAVSLAINLAQTLIASLSATEAERVAHLADLKGRLDVTRAGVHATAKEAAERAAKLDEDIHG